MARKKQKNISQYQKRRNLSGVRETLQPLVDKANSIVRQLMNKSIMPHSLMMAQNTLNKRGREIAAETGDLFTTSHPRYRDLRREAHRIQNFLADESSGLTAKEEAEAYKNKYGMLFGGQYYDIYGVTYDFSKISEAQAQQIFSVYRKLEEQYANELQGKSGFGSDNLIMALYDASLGSGASWMPDTLTEEVMFSRGRELLQNFRAEREGRAELNLSDVNLGELEAFEAYNAQDFFNRRNW